MERSAIVDECMALIAPDAQHETECRRQIELMVTLLHRVKTPKIKPPSEEKQPARLMYPTAEGRKVHYEALLRFADALAEAAAQLPHCGWILEIPFQDALIEAAAQLPPTARGLFMCRIWSCGFLRSFISFMLMSFRSSLKFW